MKSFLIFAKGVYIQGLSHLKKRKRKSTKKNFQHQNSLHPGYQINDFFFFFFLNQWPFTVSHKHIKLYKWYIQLILQNANANLLLN